MDDACGQASVTRGREVDPTNSKLVAINPVIRMQAKEDITGWQLSSHADILLVFDKSLLCVAGSSPYMLKHLETVTGQVTGRAMLRTYSNW